MKFSICLPVYDRADKLCEALASICEQTHQDFEVVLKDGCHRHPALRSKELSDVRKILGTRLHYILSTDGGIFPALNEAMMHAIGDVFYFMCSDDLLAEPDVLADLDGHFRGRENEPFWVYGKVRNINERGETLDDAVEKTTLPELMERNRLGQPSVFWNRRMFSEVGFFTYKHAADYDYWIRCWKVADPLWMPRVLGAFRHWPEQNTEKHRLQTEAEARVISAKHLEDRRKR